LIKVRTGIDLRIDLIGAQVLELGQLVLAERKCRQAQKDEKQTTHSVPS
jgi:hypothetical protein